MEMEKKEEEKSSMSCNSLIEMPGYQTTRRMGGRYVNVSGFGIASTSLDCGPWIHHSENGNYTVYDLRCFRNSIRTWFSESRRD